MKPIAEQAEEKKTPMESLVGKTAEVLRGRGFEVPPEVPDYAILRAETPKDRHEINTHAFGKRTGYYWQVVVAQPLADEIAKEIDARVIGELMASSKPS